LEIFFCQQISFVALLLIIFVAARIEGGDFFGRQQMWGWINLVQG
jgi:hypothetical protein